MQFSDKDWASILLTGTGNPIQGPCYLAQVVLTPDLVDNCEVHIYDSLGSTNNEIAHIRAWSPETRPVFYVRPFKIHNGIYVLFDDHTESVQLIYKPIYSDRKVID
jgi:hypothetical protein